MSSLALLVPIAILGYLLWRSQRSLERAHADALTERAALLTNAAQERASLLNRIQSPEVEAAVSRFEGGRQHTNWDDDEDFWKAKDEADGLVSS